MVRLANNVVIFKSAGQLYRSTLLGFSLAAPPVVIPGTAGVLEFDLSHDGSRLALTFSANSNGFLYTMNVDGTDLTSINGNGSVHQSGMSWGRDGYIYFVQSAIGNAFSQTLYRIPENGSNNAVQLTGYFSQFPAAGGIGNKVAFLHDYPVKRLRTMNGDGSGTTDVPGVTAGDGGYIGIDSFTDLIYYPVGDQIWRVRFDGSGNQQLTSGAFPGFVDYGTITLDNTPPVVTTVTVNPNPALVNAVLTLSASFVDAGGSGLAMAQYTVNGGSPQMMASLSGSAATASIGIAGFSTPGVNNFCVRAQDLAGNIGQYQCALVAVYDPNGGFVTGGGWISTSSGKSNFGLVAKYQQNNSLPTGNFELNTQGQKFKSASFAWLVVTGNTAVLYGTGEWNGSPGYQFQVTVLDQSSGDQIGVRIWNGSGVVLDIPATSLGGGQIVIH